MWPRWNKKEWKKNFKKIEKGNKSPNKKRERKVQIEKGYKSPNKIWKVNQGNLIDFPE